jgi:hypothetical protein
MVERTCHGGKGGVPDVASETPESDDLGARRLGIATRPLAPAEAEALTSSTGPTSSVVSQI